MRASATPMLSDLITSLLDVAFRRGGILGYHGISAGAPVPSPSMHVTQSRFREQIESLRSRYEVVPLHELVARHQSARSIDGLLAITFDDAYVGVARHAAPILAELDVPATIFVASEPSAEGAQFWWDQLEKARTTSPSEAFPAILAALGLPDLTPTEESVEKIREHLLASHAGRAPRLLESARLPLSPDLRAMSFEELRALGADARFDFGCHTVTHAALPLLSAEEAHGEITNGYRRLVDELPRVRPILAFPFGLYDEDTVRTAEAAGMRAAVTLQGRGLTQHDHPLALPRLCVGEHRTVTSMRLRLNGGLRRVMISRDGSLHPFMPVEPFAAQSGGQRVMLPTKSPEASAPHRSSLEHSNEKV